MLVISWFAGVGLFLDRLMPKVHDKFPAGVALLGAVAVGPLLCFGVVFAGALLAALAGQLLGGHATSLQLRAALAWANAPLLLLLPLWALVSALGGAMPKGAIDLIGAGLLVWAEVLAVVLVAEVQTFSIGRALGTTLLAWFIKIGIVIGIAVLVTGAEHRGSRAKDGSRQPAAARVP